MANNLQNITGIEKLRPEQLHAIELLVDYEKSLNYEEVANEVGVTVKTLWNWRHKDENFIEVKRQMALKGLSEKIDRVNQTLVKGAIEGEPRLVKLFYEIVGEYIERTEITGKDGGPIEYKDAREKFKKIINRAAERKEKRED